MENGRYQKAKFIHEMLAEESGHSLNMQVVLAGLSEGELQTLENIASKCRESRQEQQVEPQTVTFVLDWEEQFA